MDCVRKLFLKQNSSSFRYLPHGRPRHQPCVFVYARCKHSCIVIVHCVVVVFGSVSHPWRPTIPPLNKMKDRTKCPLAWSQLVKCVPMAAKVWMSTIVPRGGLCLPTTQAHNEEGIRRSETPHAPTPKGETWWGCGVAKDVSTFSGLIPEFKAFFFLFFFHPSLP